MNRYRFDSENHVHLFDNKPLIGTSTIAGSVGKGSALIYWAVGMAVKELGWTNPKIVTDYDTRVQNAADKLGEIKTYKSSEYLSLLDKAYRAHSKELKKTADKGVDLHAEIEKYVKSQITGEPIIKELFENEEIKKQLEPFIKWCETNVKKWLFSEVHVYSEELWTGGIIDAGYIDMNDEFVLADFKSGGAWLSGFVQLGGYAAEMRDTHNQCLDKDGNVVFTLDFKKYYNPDSLAIFPFKGGFKEPVIITGQTQKYMRGFENAVALYKLQKEFEELNGK